MNEILFEANKPNEQTEDILEEKSLGEGPKIPKLESSSSLPPALLPEGNPWTAKTIAIGVVVILAVLVGSIGVVAAATGKFPKRSPSTPASQTNFEDLLPSPSPVSSPEVEVENTPTPSPKPTKSPIPTLRPTPRPTSSPSPTPSPTPTPLPSPTPTPSPTPSPTPTAAPTPTPTPVPDPSPIPSPDQ